MRKAAMAALCAVLVGCTSSPTPNAVVSPGAAASSARTGPEISPPPVTPPTPPGNDLPAFVCTNATGGSQGTANVTAVRVAQDTGYDRFVLQFDSLVPAYTVMRQAKPVFTQGPSGQSITLIGTAGALITVRSASAANTYSGPTDLPEVNFPVLKEARLTEDFEGVVSWGLGLGTPACMRVFTTSDPARLVVDFTTA